MAQGSQDSSDGIVTMLQTGQLRGHGLIPDRGMQVFSSPHHPNQLWGPSSLLSNG
jgi:hypothetical protein